MSIVNGIALADRTSNVSMIRNLQRNVLGSSQRLHTMETRRNANRSSLAINSVFPRLLLVAALCVTIAGLVSACDPASPARSDDRSIGILEETTAPTSAVEQEPSTFDTELLAIMVLDPADLGTVANELVFLPDGGWIPNIAASGDSWNPADSEGTWEQLGRVTGYDLPMWGYIGDDEVILNTSVEEFRTEALAQRGLEAWVTDLEYAHVDLVGPGGYVGIRSESVPGIGDAAVLVTTTAPDTDQHLSMVWFRSGPLVGSLALSRTRVSAHDETLVLAERLDQRIQRVLRGELSAAPVPAPGFFTPRALLPEPALLNDRSLARRFTEPPCPGSGRRVCLMAIGPDTGVDLAAFADELRALYGLVVDVAPPLALDGLGADWPDLADYGRHRIESGSLWNLVYDLYPVDQFDPEVSVIAVTAYDFYNVERPRLNYFYRVGAASDGPKMIIISNARFDDESWGMPPNPEALRSRTLKLMTREIGQLHYGLPIDASGDRHSVLQTFPAPWGIDRFDETLPLDLLR